MFAAVACFRTVRLYKDKRAPAAMKEEHIGCHLEDLHLLLAAGDLLVGHDALQQQLHLRHALLLIAASHMQSKVDIPFLSHVFQS